MMAQGGPVLVVDDDASCRRLIKSVLEGAGYRTVEAKTGEEALALVRSERPSLVILDVKLTGLSGYEVCRELKETFGKGLPIFFVSGERTDSFDRVGGLLIGADDYVVKPFAPDELIARVRRYVTPAETVSRGPQESTFGLTQREFEVLGLLADGFGQLEIATNLVISPKTVGTHIQRILTKLQVHSRAQAVAIAHRDGLLGLRSVRTH
jgi:DNA-binding NarL/FixJ family response regulator